MVINVESAILEEATVSTSLPLLDRDRKIPFIMRPTIPILVIRYKSEFLVFSVMSSMCQRCRFLIQSVVVCTLHFLSLILLVACVNNLNEYCIRPPKMKSGTNWRSRFPNNNHVVLQCSSCDTINEAFGPTSSHGCNHIRLLGL